MFYRTALLFLVASIAVVALGLTETSRAHAQDTPRIASTTISPDSATVGDRLTLTITVEHPSDTRVDGPGFDANFGDFEIVDVGTPQKISGSD
ncbi:MAG TPA: hypothetical protein VIH21_10745, partial [Dehalococcoidia bacterium]